VDLGEEHLDAGFEQEEAAAEAIDDGDGDDGGQDVDGADDDGGVEGGGALEAEGLEEDGGVEHDGIDAGELLEELHDHGDDELGAVAALEDVAEGVLDGGGFVAGDEDVAELLVHVLDAADLLQDLAAALELAALHERVGRVRQQDAAQGDEGGGHAGDAQRDAPAVVRHLLRAVVHQVGPQDADGDRELEQDVERAAPLGRRHLGQVERHRLVGEPDPPAQAQPPDEEHGERLRRGRENHPQAERHPRYQHRRLPPPVPRRVRGEERRHQRRDVERGRERHQLLVVILAVRALLRRPLPHHHCRKKLLQKLIHGRHAACTQIHPPSPITHHPKTKTSTFPTATRHSPCTVAPNVVTNQYLKFLRRIRT
jgi:hypothetical protein